MKELIKLGKFDLFASEYCIYSNHEINLDDLIYGKTKDESFKSYYQIIWDYKMYLETISMYEIEKV